MNCLAFNLRHRIYQLCSKFSYSRTRFGLPCKCVQYTLPVFVYAYDQGVVSLTRFDIIVFLTKRSSILPLSVHIHSHDDVVVWHTPECMNLAQSMSFRGIGCHRLLYRRVIISHSSPDPAQCPLDLSVPLGGAFCRMHAHVEVDGHIGVRQVVPIGSHRLCLCLEPMCETLLSNILVKNEDASTLDGKSVSQRS